MNFTQLLFQTTFGQEKVDCDALLSSILLSEVGRIVSYPPVVDAIGKFNNFVLCLYSEVCFSHKGKAVLGLNPFCFGGSEYLLTASFRAAKEQGKNVTKGKTITGSISLTQQCQFFSYTCCVVRCFCINRFL